MQGILTPINYILCNNNPLSHGSLPLIIQTLGNAGFLHFTRQSTLILRCFPVERYYLKILSPSDAYCICLIRMSGYKITCDYAAIYCFQMSCPIYRMMFIVEPVGVLVILTASVLCSYVRHNRTM